jgi:hypothetical protein
LTLYADDWETKGTPLLFQLLGDFGLEASFVFLFLVAVGLLYRIASFVNDRRLRHSQYGVPE